MQWSAPELGQVQKAQHRFMLGLKVGKNFLKFNFIIGGGNIFTSFKNQKENMSTQRPAPRPVPQLDASDVLQWVGERMNKLWYMQTREYFHNYEEMS